MKKTSITSWFWRPIRWTAAGLAAGALLTARLAAADAAPADAAATAPAAPPAPPAGTWYVFTPPKEGEVVPIALRDKLLKVAGAFVQRDKPDLLAKLIMADDPFYLKLPPPPTPVTATGSTGATATAPAAAAKLTDEDKLKEVAAAVMPTGVMEAGNVRLVLFAKREAVQVGESFPVPFPNDPAPSEIKVIDANDTSCVLQLGTTTFSADFVANSSAPPSARPAAPSTSATK